MNMPNKGMRYALLGLALGLTIYSIYTWHQNRKSNTDERAVKVENYADYSVATFAGGCFWCTESDFEKTDGVVAAVSGYTGGYTENPTYTQTSSGTTGHREAVQVYYDPEKVSYVQLLDVFWRHHDPTDGTGSFGDRGSQYSTAIFYHDESQQATAEASKAELDAKNVFDKPIATPLIAATTFYLAEDYHQDYYKKNPTAYGFYRGRSGREDYIDQYWGDQLKEAQHHQKEQGTKKNETENEVTTNQSATKVVTKQKTMADFKNFTKPSKDELKKKLTELQYKVTQKEGTEKPFENEYNDNKEEGIYVDVVSGEPLYSSTDKYDSGTGWPSFTKPIDANFIAEKKDYKMILPRTEVRSKYGDNHLGHVFNDGPKDDGGKRYCMNSAAMKFIPKAELEKEGYAQYLSLFE